MASNGGATTTAPAALPTNDGKHPRYRPQQRYGYGGAIALGNARRPMSNAQAQQLMQAAWDAGIRYYDTSPWYGLGLSEQRIGYFLADRQPQEYEISSKTGRLLHAEPGYSHDNWQDAVGFRYEYDYSASATRRSVEDSLQRMGVSSLDLVFIHDLSPDNVDLGDGWREALIHCPAARDFALVTSARFEEFCASGLDGLDEVAHDYFGTDRCRDIIRWKVASLFPEHEVDEYTERFWDLIQQWRATDTSDPS